MKIMLFGKNDLHEMMITFPELGHLERMLFKKTLKTALEKIKGVTSISCENFGRHPSIKMTVTTDTICKNMENELRTIFSASFQMTPEKITVSYHQLHSPIGVASIY